MFHTFKVIFVSAIVCALLLTFIHAQFGVEFPRWIRWGLGFVGYLVLRSIWYERNEN